jgi:hypothetical protein
MIMTHWDVMLCHLVNISSNLADCMGSSQKYVILIFAAVRTSETYAIYYCIRYNKG